MSEHSVPIAFLTKPEWQHPRLAANTMVITDRRSSSHVNQSLIKARERFTPDLWDGTIAAAFHAGRDDRGRPEIVIGSCSYFQYLSACGALEEETYRAAKDPRCPTPLRDQHASNLSDLAQCSLGAHGLGMQVAVVSEEEGSRYVLLQRRSQTTTPYGGAAAVIPALACQPPPTPPPFGLDYFFWNFIREFGEELYGIPDLSRADSGARPDPHWFLHDDRLKPVVDARIQGQLAFEVLGFGFDALTGEGNVAALAYFREPLKLHSMRSNHEVEQVWMEPIDSENLVSLIVEHRFQPGSAFALTLALDRLSDFPPA